MGGIRRVSLPAVFAGFFRLGITSFGGNTAAWLYRAIVVKRRWIDDRAFLAGVALSRVLPGSGGVNLTVQVGQRLRGARGALAAVLGLLSGPLVIVVVLAMAFSKIADNEVAHAVLRGVAAAAVGLTFATGIVLVPRSAARIGEALLALATVVTVGVLRWPMLPVVACLAPLGIGLAFWRQRGGG